MAGGEILKTLMAEAISAYGVLAQCWLCLFGYEMAVGGVKLAAAAGGEMQSSEAAGEMAKLRKRPGLSAQWISCQLMWPASACQSGLKSENFLRLAKMS